MKEKWVVVTPHLGSRPVAWPPASFWGKKVDICFECCICLGGHIVCFSFLENIDVFKSCLDQSASGKMTALAVR